jgi:hypothetical protein
MNIIQLSLNKFSSQLVIRLVESFDKLRSRTIIELFLNPNLGMLAKNKYGILVLESIIKFLSHNEKTNIMNAIVTKFRIEERSLRENEGVRSVIEMLR